MAGNGSPARAGAHGPQGPGARNEYAFQVEQRPFSHVADRVTIVLVALGVGAAIAASLPRLLAPALDHGLGVAGDVLPWIVVAIAWVMLAHRAGRSALELSSLPSDVFEAAITWGAAALVVARLAFFVGPSVGRRPAAVLAVTTLEDVLYGLGVLALGALFAFAIARTLVRPALRGRVSAASIREVSLRTRFVVIAAGVSFATAGILLNVLVDFERTSDDALVGYLVIAAGLVAIATLVAWLVGDDIAVREQAAAAASAERDRIARELHDGVAKSVSIIALEAATAASRAPDALRPDLARIHRLARMLSEEMRAIVSDVRAGDDAPEFIDAVSRLVARHGLAELALEGDVEQIGTLARFEILRIVDEALTNAERHARARHIRARVAVAGERVLVEVEDDGVGLANPDWEHLANSGRYGLIGIRERAGILGGDVALEHSALGGTLLRVDVPLVRA